MRAPHKQVHANCEYGATTWADCDRAVDAVVRDWQAMQTVILAYNIALSGRRIKEDNFIARLVDYIGGHSRALLVKDGSHEDVGPEAMRVHAAIERFKAGNLPAYNLYRPALAGEEGGTA